MQSRPQPLALSICDTLHALKQDLHEHLLIMAKLSVYVGSLIYHRFR